MEGGRLIAVSGILAYQIVLSAESVHQVQHLHAQNIDKG